MVSLYQRCSDGKARWVIENSLQSTRIHHSPTYATDFLSVQPAPLRDFSMGPETSQSNNPVVDSISRDSHLSVLFCPGINRMELEIVCNMRIVTNTC